MKTLNNSFSLRVALTSCIVSGIVIVILMIGFTINVKGEIAEIVDHSMEAVAAAILSGAEEQTYKENPFNSILHFDEGSFRGTIYDDDENLKEAASNLVLVALKSSDGTFLYKDDLYWKNEYEKILNKKPTLEVGLFLSGHESNGNLSISESEHDARWEIRCYRKGGRSLYLGINQHENKDEYLELLYLSAMVVPFATIVVTLGGWWTGVFAVRPIKAMSHIVSSIKADDLTIRIPQSERMDEIGKLARLINDMLARIERGYNQARRFTADASHELRTPLAIIQAELEAQMRDSENDQESNMRILEEIRRLKTLTHSLLFLSKVDSGSVSIKTERLNLQPLVRQTLLDIKEIFKANGLEFDLALKEKDIWIDGDSALIQQTLFNLLKNAVKYNHHQGKISCSVQTMENTVVVTIGNTGATIPNEAHDKIFERFYRVYENESAKSGGYGLGLNIALEIAHVHKGKLRLKKSDNNWTEFELSLPLAHS